VSDRIDSSTVHPARRYNYWLGGKDNFAGLKLVEPGISPVSNWRPTDDPGSRPNPAQVAMYGAVGRKP
jgi:hypothetical protein